MDEEQTHLACVSHLSPSETFHSASFEEVPFVAIVNGQSCRGKVTTRDGWSKGLCNLRP